MSMKRSPWLAGGLACMSLSAFAQIPSVLLEACNMLEPAAKRLECLNKANESSRPVRQSPPVGQPSWKQPQPGQPLYAQPGGLQAAPQAGAAPGSSYMMPNGNICYVGPRGGTYTITKSGRKNYSGC